MYIFQVFFDSDWFSKFGHMTMYCRIFCILLFWCIGNAKSKTSKPPASSAAKGSSPEIKLGSYFSSSIDGKENISRRMCSM